jgi:hypothetical protein
MLQRSLTPKVVATGFTTAFLGDERTLREFVVGDFVVREMQSRGDNAVLYLFNDSLDPLNVRQLRVGVNKDPELVRRFEPFCGRPICDIPDPFGCHASYSDHFEHALVDRLDRLGIHPIVIDVHRAYRLGHYAPYVATALARYREIQDSIADACDQYTLKNLYRVQCPQCSCIDATEISAASAEAVAFTCGRCGLDTRQSADTLRGKLSWKLDCAARWNLYGVEAETFSKAHLADKGTFSVAALVSKQFFGNHVPATVKYGDLRMSPRLSGHLLEMLPPAMLKQLLTDRLTSDVELTTESVEHFASGYEVRPGLSYAAYVRRELPRDALRRVFSGDASTSWAADSEDALVAHANRYSEFYYQRRYELRWPAAETLEAEAPATVEIARGAVERALQLRDSVASEAERKATLKQYLEAIPSAPRVYPFLRKVFGQDHGASITTLLALLPREYLAAVLLILSCLAGTIQAQGGSFDEYDEDRRAA